MIFYREETNTVAELQVELNDTRMLLETVRKELTVAVKEKKALEKKLAGDNNNQNSAQIQRVCCAAKCF